MILNEFVVTSLDEFKILKVTTSRDDDDNQLIGKDGKYFKHSFFLLETKDYEMTLDISNKIIAEKPYSSHPMGYDISVKAVIHGEAAKKISKVLNMYENVCMWKKKLTKDLSTKNDNELYYVSLIRADKKSLKTAEEELQAFLDKECEPTLSSYIYKMADFKVKAAYGDIVVTNFTSCACGSEINKRRPAIIVSNNSYNVTSNMRLLCPITRTPRLYSVAIPEGLPVRGYILPQQIKSYDLQERATEVVGHIDSLTLKELSSMLVNFV